MQRAIRVFGEFYTTNSGTRLNAMNEAKAPPGATVASCFSGLAIAFCGLLIGGFGLCALTYETQKVFNPVPLCNGIYELGYLITFPVGGFVGAVAASIGWGFRPKGKRLLALILGVLILFGIWDYATFNSITDADDPMFAGEHSC